MKLFHKIFLGLLVLFVILGLYAIDWKIGFMHEENAQFILSVASGLLGILVIILMNTWSKLAAKK